MQENLHPPLRNVRKFTTPPTSPLSVKNVRNNHPKTAADLYINQAIKFPKPLPPPALACGKIGTPPHPPFDRAIFERSLSK